MREMSINSQRPQREASADRPADQQSERDDLNNQLYRAYLSGDGAAVERIMALLEKAPAAR